MLRWYLYVLEAPSGEPITNLKLIVVAFVQIMCDVLLSVLCVYIPFMHDSELLFCEVLSEAGLSWTAAYSDSHNRYMLAFHYITLLG